MRSLIPAVLLLALVGAALAGPDDAVNKLIEQLGADTLAEREGAAKALDKIGAPALEALRKAVNHPDAEVRKRAGDLASKIGRRAAGDVVLAPKMIHLVLKDTPVKEAVKAFADKSGYDIVLSDPNDKLKDKTVTLDTGKVSFWAAMEKFRNAVGVVESDPNGVGILMPPGARPVPLVPARDGAPGAPPPKLKPAKDDTNAKETDTPPRPPAAGGKPLMLPPGAASAAMYHQPVPAGRILLVPGEAKVPEDTATSLRVRPGDRNRVQMPPGAKEIGVALEISAEPRLNIQFVESLQIDVAEDDQGQMLKKAFPLANAPFMHGVGIVGFPTSSNGVSVLTALRLTRGEKEAKSLKRLEGSVTVNVLGQKEDMLVIESPGKAAAGTSARGKFGGKLEITAVKKNTDGSTRIEFEMAAPPAARPMTSTRDVVPEMFITLEGALPRAGGVPLPVLFEGQTALQTPWGLTLQDDKGRALSAAIRLSPKMPGSFKDEYVAIYMPGADGKGEAARLVFSGRAQVQVQVPFKLANVDLK